MLRRLQIRAPGDYERHWRVYAEEKKQILLSVRKGGDVGVSMQAGSHYRSGNSGQAELLIKMLEEYEEYQDGLDALEEAMQEDWDRTGFQE